MEEIIYSDNGKYKTVNNNGILTVYRNGELWMDKELIGNKYILSLVQEIEKKNDEIKHLKSLIGKNINND